MVKPSSKLQKTAADNGLTMHMCVKCWSLQICLQFGDGTPLSSFLRCGIFRWGIVDRCEHEINTRGNGSCVVLPKMRTETGKKSFAYQGARIFNRLEKTTRDEKSILLFKGKLKLSKSL